MEGALNKSETARNIAGVVDEAGYIRTTFGLKIAYASSPRSPC